MFTDMTLRDLFPSFSREISRLMLCFSKKRKRRREKRKVSVLRSVKVFRDEPRLTVILLGYSPGQFSSYRLPAPVYFLPGRPSRILINRSTARSRFFVTVVRKNGVSSNILERSLRNWLSFFRVEDTLNPRIIYSYHVVGFFFSLGMEWRSAVSMLIICPD